MSEQTTGNGNKAAERPVFNASAHNERSAQAIREGRSPFDAAAGAAERYSAIEKASHPRVMEIPLHLIYVRDSQTRTKANEQVGLQELKAIIREEGFNSAILVMRVGEKFEVVAGHRRFLAARELGQAAIPCVVTNAVDERKRLVRQITENTQRSDYHPVELALALAQLMEASPGAEQREVAESVGIAATRFSEILKIARLPSAVRDALSGRALVESNAILVASLYEIYRTKLPKEGSAIKRTTEIVGRITKDGWSQKALRNFIAKERERLGAVRRTKGKPEAPADALAGTADGVQGGDPLEAPASLFTRTEATLTIDLAYLERGAATADEKATLAGELDAILARLRTGPDAPAGEGRGGA